jgi:hypothetical protein
MSLFLPKSPETSSASVTDNQSNSPEAPSASVIENPFLSNNDLSAKKEEKGKASPRFKDDEDECQVPTELDNGKSYSPPSNSKLQSFLPGTNEIRKLPAVPGSAGISKKSLDSPKRHRLSSEMKANLAEEKSTSQFTQKKREEEKVCLDVQINIHENKEITPTNQKQQLKIGGNPCKEEKI